MTRFSTKAAGLGVLLVSALALGACASRQDPSRASVEYRGTGGTGQAAAAATRPASPSAPVTGAGGIISYDGYDAIVARDGDSVASLADRVGLAASELGAYNGLSPNQQLRAGDELVLPPRPGGYGGTAVAAAAPATTGGFSPAPAEPTAPIEAAPLGTGGAPAPATEAAPSAAPTWSPSVAAAAIDRAAEPTPPAASAPAVAAPGTGTELSPPPSSGTPLPSEPERQSASIESPNLSQYQTPSPSARPTTAANAAEQRAAEVDRAAEQQLAAATAATAGSRPQGMETLALVRPVDGPVVVGYNTWGPGGTRNEGVDFGAAPGTPVKAAADGTVALVSPSLGGLGTIVVLRHPNEVLTVYGRVDGVTVGKGASIRRGQVIGQVANPPEGAGEARMHFEVRRGAASVDPMLFF